MIKFQTLNRENNSLIVLFSFFPFDRGESLGTRLDPAFSEGLTLSRQELCFPDVEVGNH